MITLERVGRRVYVAGDSYAVRDRLRAAGCHWDAERRQWWIGTAGASAVEAIAADAAAAPAAAAPRGVPDDARVSARVEVEGRRLYLIARSGDGRRLRVCSLDGSVDRWVDADAARVLRTYPPRRYRGREEHTTIGSLRRFVARQREIEGAARSSSPAELRAAGWRECWECGRLCPPDRLDADGYCGC